MAYALDFAKVRIIEGLHISESTPVTPTLGCGNINVITAFLPSVENAFVEKRKCVGAVCEIE